ncbi:MAG: hypothetical protein RLZZ490_1359, partial [Cyanobacteriota bacterium]
MKNILLLIISLSGNLALITIAQAQPVNVPTFARPQVTAPKIALPSSRPSLSRPNISPPTLTPQTSISFPTTTTTVSVPSFPNVNNLGDRLIQSPQTISFPSQSLPTQFLPTSVTPS